MGLLKGKSWVFGDNINTDLIIPFRFKARTNDPEEMSKYCMYGIDPDFHKKVSPGDFVVAGKNFGGGSSREQAPVAIKYCRISAVIAESFARIFFRNAFAIGLPVLEVEGISKGVKHGELLEVDLDNFMVRNASTGETYQAKRVSGFLLDLMKEGGLVNYYRKHSRFPWEIELAKTS